MAISTTALAADHAAILADLPETMAHGVDTDITCNRVSMQARELAIQDRDFVATYRFTLSALASDFTATPVENDTVTYESTTWTVLRTDESPDGVDLRIHVGDEYAG